MVIGSIWPRSRLATLSVAAGPSHWRSSSICASAGYHGTAFRRCVSRIMGQILGRKQKSGSCFTHKAGIQRAGGTGIEPATCGCGACCRTFGSVPERTRSGLKRPILTLESMWTFPRVHQRWRKIWRQLLMRTLELLVPVMWSRAVQSVRQPEGLVTPQWTSRAVFDLCPNDATEEM